MKQIIIFILVICSTAFLWGQENVDTTQYIINIQKHDVDTGKHVGWLKRLKTKRQIKEQQGKFLITPVIGPGYTPELGFSLAGGALMSFLTKKNDSLLQRSSVSATLGVSTTGAIFLSTKVASFWLHDKLRINADIWFKNMPDNYFGVGYENGKNTPKSDSTTKYKRTWIQFNPQVFWQFKPTYFAGGLVDINYTQGKDASVGVATDSNYIEYNDKPFNVGLGVHFLIDSRDIPVNAWKGWYLLLQATFYGKYFGGNNNYEVFNLDARYYRRLFKPGQTLAIQLRGRFAVGDVPYGEMSQIGTPFDLRGYLWGQYRDKDMLFAIVEYRHCFYKRNGQRSRHEVVGWLAGGTLASNFGFNNFLPNGGIGYRIEVQPRMAIRLDFGVGRKTVGFYFNFNEAF